MVQLYRLCFVGLELKLESLELFHRFYYRHQTKPAPYIPAINDPLTTGFYGASDKEKLYICKNNLKILFIILL